MLLLSNVLKTTSNMPPVPIYLYHFSHKNDQIMYSTYVVYTVSPSLAATICRNRAAL